MYKKNLIRGAVIATMLLGATTVHSATLSISGGYDANLNSDFSLAVETGLAIGTAVKYFNSSNDGSGTGLMLAGAPTDVTFEFLGSEAGNTNRAYETEGSTSILFNSNTASVGDTDVVSVSSDGALPFRFKSTSCWWIFCSSDRANNDGNIDQGLTIALFLESSTSVIALFGDGSGDFDLDDMAMRISVTAIPLPPSLVLFGGALVGLGFLARRRRKSTSA